MTSPITLQDISSYITSEIKDKIKEASGCSIVTIDNILNGKTKRSKYEKYVIAFGIAEKNRLESVAHKSINQQDKV